DAHQYPITTLLAVDGAHHFCPAAHFMNDTLNEIRVHIPVKPATHSGAKFTTFKKSSLSQTVIS
ncbi:hypothetical protein KKE07_05150, partial [Candidatus Dependentiae bacterium]|nr:hypothetical protein [Candidatus Dependentiae bacterium]